MQSKQNRPKTWKKAFATWNFSSISISFVDIGIGHISNYFNPCHNAKIISLFFPIQNLKLKRKRIKPANTFYFQKALLKKVFTPGRPPLIERFPLSTL